MEEDTNMSSSGKIDLTTRGCMPLRWIVIEEIQHTAPIQFNILRKKLEKRLDKTIPDTTLKSIIRDLEMGRLIHTLKFLDADGRYQKKIYIWGLDGKEKN